MAFSSFLSWQLLVDCAKCNLSRAVLWLPSEATPQNSSRWWSFLWLNPHIYFFYICRMLNLFVQSFGHT